MPPPEGPPFPQWPGSGRPATCLAREDWVWRSRQAVCQQTLFGTSRADGVGTRGCFLWLMGQLPHLDRWHSRG